MNNQQISNDDIKKYLVTEAVDTGKIPSTKKEDDLRFLQKSEARSNYVPDISKDIEDPALSRAVKALRLSNPFKGY